MATVTAYNLGNADTSRIDLNNGKKVLIDYADMRSKNDPNDRRVDLAAQLLKDLTDKKRDYYDVVAFTHLDNDHICGSTKFFHLLHHTQYQGAGRIHIREMWVPAAAILEKEEECNEEARILRTEAQYRLKKGEGIRVFSNPGKLNEWFRRRQIDPASRKHLITDAGNLIPGFSLATDDVEFFVHSPFASRSNEGTLIERNSDALTFQATFEEYGRKTRMHFFSDIDWEVVKYIVRVTRNRAKHDASRLDRLKWNVFHLPHHSSAYSLAADKGTTTTVPDPDIKELFETYGEYAGIMISPSDETPTVNTIQPPHVQAANYYRSVAKLNSGTYLVTMEQPTKASPKPLVIEIDRFGATVKKDTGGNSAFVLGGQVTPRAGGRF